MSVVTRFAPSPTGFLHIGGARTALFNYLFARHFGGTYLLRIEDTDKKRSTDEAIHAIKDGLDWLGLAGDRPAVLQSENEVRHRAVVEDMLASGTAYKCFLDNDELDALRAEARENGLPVRSPWRNRTDHPEHGSFVVRIKMPDEGATQIDDLVQGSVSIENKTLDDLVLLRSDGTPTYMLAVVVDDHDMGVTHILRGDDHLNNAFRQYYIYQAAGWDVPAFGHIPLIHGADGAKLSKRHGALGVDTYREMGFVPAGLLNYLARLGWSHGDDELFSLEMAASWFDGSAIGRSPSRFDMDKLRAVNAHWLQQIEAGEMAQMVIAFMEGQGHSAHARTAGWLEAMSGLFTERASTVVDVAEQTGWLFTEGAPQLSDEAAGQIDTDVKERLLKFARFLEQAPTNSDELNIAIADWLAAEGLKMKELGIPLRIVMTGSKKAPSLVDIILGLGADETVKRIKQICF